MRVKDLLELLTEADPEATVMVRDGYGDPREASLVKEVDSTATGDEVGTSHETKKYEEGTNFLKIE